MKFRSGLLQLALAGGLSFAAFPAHGGVIFYNPPGAPEDTWDGAYVGVDGGYAWSSSTGPATLSSSGSRTAGGYFGGGLIGYNWQGLFGIDEHILVGAEADLQAGDISVSSTDAFADSIKSSLDWFSTIRGRLGYGFSPILFYITGGIALGGIKSSVTGPNPAFGGASYTFDDIATGYAFGGGAEYKFSPAWSFKVEYLSLNFGKNALTSSAGASYGASGGSYITSREDLYNTFTFGLSYHPLCCAPPLK